MTFVTLGRVPVEVLGTLETLIWFCEFISKGSRKPYHAEYFKEKLFVRMEPWSVDLKPNKIQRLLDQSYQMALEKHAATNPTGWPLPQPIRYFPWLNAIRYRTTHGVIITLDLATHLILVQNSDSRLLQCYARREEMSPIIQLPTEKVLLPSQVHNWALPLDSLCNFLTPTRY